MPEFYMCLILYTEILNDPQKHHLKAFHSHLERFTLPSQTAIFT